MLHNRSAYPVGLGVSTDSFMEGVNHDDLEDLIGRILGHPVAVENAESFNPSSGTFLKYETSITHVKT